MRRLEGKVAIVTGGASGLGLASARRFASEGARVACLDLDGAAAARAAAAIEGEALGLAADVTDEAALAAAVAEVGERFGPADVLYANAGIPGEGRVHELTLEHWNRVLAVNLTGVFLSARAVLARRDRDYPLGRLGREDDNASLALFLASEEAAWITGAAYPVDGGATAVSLWAPPS